MDIKTETLRNKRLSMRLPEEIHKRLKEITDIRGTTITKYVMRLVIEALVKESKYK